MENLLNYVSGIPQDKSASVQLIKFSTTTRKLSSSSMTSHRGRPSTKSNRSGKKKSPSQIQTHVIFYFYYIVYGLAANKSDLYDKSTVSEDEARRFAREINAVFSSTSALVNSGITELYTELAEKVTSSQKKEKENKKISIDAKKKKGGCCHSKKEKKRLTLLSEGNDC